MSCATFDAKFGSDLVGGAPTGPGVYRFLSGDGTVLYVGKAKNLRRRLSNYRNASRKRVHRKMRTLVREASALSYETSESEPAALLLESELIRELRPQFNVDGAFAFLYPSLGLGSWNKTTLVCFTTHPEAYRELELQWFGCFRSRPRVKAAFRALAEVLSLLAHREKAAQLPVHPRIKGSQLLGYRQMPAELRASLPAFFSGEAADLPSQLSRLLLDRPRALRRASEVQSHLQQLLLFFEQDAAKLREALKTLGMDARHIGQDERDALFIRAASARREPRPSAATLERR